MVAKLKGASSLGSGSVVEGQLAQTEAAPALPADQPVSAPAADEGDGSTKKKVKGHGRNGAQAFVNAKHFAHGLSAELLGARCPACELGRLSRYREKVVIRVVGQPLFSPELHHIEQARCRNCGKVVRAEAPAGLLETPRGAVVLFFTGRHHAGEVLDQLLVHRRPAAGSPRLVEVTDGASKNFDHQHREELIEATCNAHAFLEFHDVEDQHPGEYALAGEVYNAVFDNDDAAEGLTPDERMRFHRERSKPLMEKLKAMCEGKLKSKLVEPSSALWEPLTFIINQWERLTRFYEVPGVRLDTNLVEQKLIIPVRYLAASFNYKTEPAPRSATA